MSKFKWKATSEFAVHWCELDGQFLVYHSGSSDTHLLELSAKNIIDVLNKSCLTTNELTDYLSDKKDNTLDFELSDVTEILQQLKKIHLVKAIPT